MTFTEAIPHTDSFLPLGVCALPVPPLNAPRTVQNADYIHEILGHAGIGYQRVDFEALEERLSGLRLLVTVGERKFDEALSERLTRWVRDEGGAWVSVGGLCGMESLLGATYEPASFVLWGGSLRMLGEGFLDARGSVHPVLADLPLPLHFFSGVAVRRDGDIGADAVGAILDAHHRETDSPALLERRVGKGRCLLLTPDIVGAIVRIQQGVAVTRDGVPAPDGTGPVSDGVLKSDDGQVLDWLLDRQPVPGVPGLCAFLQPIADQWRGVLLRSLFHVASQQRVALPLLWYWPHGRTAIGHISHDTDGNDPGLCRLLLKTMREAETRSTWCVILPGYDAALIDAIRADGHELATHFDAMSPGCPWGEGYFDRQWRLLREMFGPENAPVTNKNHYLRWEGDTEFYEWCIARGIGLDQSKGASKTGEAGFNFGTCHLYRPVSPQGDILPILELATPTQDLCVFAPTDIVPPLLDAAVRQYGVLHLLFHPAHIDKPGVADSIKDAVRAGKDRGLEWWTGRELLEWEEARRGARWSVSEDGSFMLTADAPLPGATVLVLATEGGKGESIERWGFSFKAVTRDLAAGERLQTRLWHRDSP